MSVKLVHFFQMHKNQFCVSQPMMSLVARVLATSPLSTCHHTKHITAEEGASCILLVGFRNEKTRGCGHYLLEYSQTAAEGFLTMYFLQTNVCGRLPFTLKKEVLRFARLRIRRQLSSRRQGCWFTHICVACPEISKATTPTPTNTYIHASMHARSQPLSLSF